MRKYDIYLADLNPKKDHTQAGIRPCVIVQSNAFNKYSSTVIVVPLTTVKKKIFPSEFIILPSKQNGLTDESRFLGSQIITLDKRYFGKKIGVLEDKYLLVLKESLFLVLDVDDDFGKD